MGNVISPNLYKIDYNNLSQIASPVLKPLQFGNGYNGLQTLLNLLNSLAPVPQLGQSKNNPPTNKSTFGGNKILAQGAGLATDYLANLLGTNLFGDDTEIDRNLGSIFGTSASAFGSTLLNNLVKGNSLLQGAGQDLLASLSGIGAGIAGNYLGLGISALGGDSMTSRGVGTAIGTAAGGFGGRVLSNLTSGTSLLNGFKTSKDTLKAIEATKSLAEMARTTGNAAKAAELSQQASNMAKAAKFTNWANIGGLAGTAVGMGLSAAFGPSKEYGGEYGNITQTMDTAYDLIQAGVGFAGPVGAITSGGMALNKGLSNIFGSTDGMTKTDAILGSAFMPAPVKWLNMWGASTTGDFYRQSWLNSEKTKNFMGSSFGNLLSRFDQATKEAGKTYGTFSLGDKREAQANLDYANMAWGKVLDMADLNIYLNIRSNDMTSINNQRYAQKIQGGWSPLSRGKLGMKIFNNATNHNIGMRLLSGAALIDNKQLILSNATLEIK